MCNIADAIRICALRQRIASYLPGRSHRDAIRICALRQRRPARPVSAWPWDAIRICALRQSAVILFGAAGIAGCNPHLCAEAKDGVGGQAGEIARCNPHLCAEAKDASVFATIRMLMMQSAFVRCNSN